MKKFYVFVALLSLLLSVETHAAVCRLHTEGYGTFEGTAKTESKAYELAVNECFDSLKLLKEKKSRNPADEDQQLSFMNYCVNLICE